MQQALTLVFVETKKGADSLEYWLCMNASLLPRTIHGDRTQQVFVSLVPKAKIHQNSNIVNDLLRLS